MNNSAKSSRSRVKILFAAGFILLAAAALLGIFLGGTPLSFEEIFSCFENGFLSSAGGRIFLYVRLPRTLAAIVCGGALAMSGAVIQAVLANR
ncbi:MAG: iron chelate uptake ABC transporter family permease subunit, partial [Ruminiclostridium sp.]